MSGSGSASAPSLPEEPRDPPWGRTRWGRTRWGPVSRRRRWRQSQALRIVAAALVGVAAWLTVGAVMPQPADPGVPTVVAARDLALGSTVTADDLRVERRPEAQRPAGALADPGEAVGEVVSGPVAAGEIVTPARFRGPAQLGGLGPGLVAVSLPVTDPILLTTLRPADTVSVLATGSGQPLATAARVLATDLRNTGVIAAGGAGPGHLVVAVTADEARNLAVALGPQGATAGLLVALRG
jgi:Flp pilus assembly protein CpaB